MEIHDVRALRGPNVWARVPVLELRVARDGATPGLVDRLAVRLPELADRLTPDLDVEEVLGRLTLGLQRIAGSPVGFCRTDRGTATVVVEYEEEALGRACLDAARELIRAARDDAPIDAQALVHRLKEAAYFACLGTSTRAIVDAATARGIPYRRLNDGSLVLLGWGARQRRILTAETDRTSAIAESIAQDKELTRSLLKGVGVPVPEGRPVGSAEDAWEAAREIGPPVVVKPRDANHARGVATNLSTREQVAAAYQAAAREGQGVLVERYAPGVDHRLLVVDGRLVAAARREPATIEGDGRSTVREMVDRINQDPRRGDGFLTPLGRIPFDEPALAVLAEQGLTPESVPPAGARVALRKHSHIITGGTAFDVTDRVHPEVAARAVEAAQAVGLDVAGIDIVAEDVSRPLEDQRAVVVEVNAGPGLGLHLPPWSDPPRPVGEAIVGALFPEGDGRIPLVAAIGPHAPATCRLLAHLLGRRGLAVGRAEPAGLFVGGRRIVARDGSAAAGALDLLINPQVDAAVLAIATESVVREGLGFDRCDAAIVAGPVGDERIVKALLDTVAVAGVIVLPASHPLAAALAEADPGRLLVYRDGTDPSPAIRPGLAGIRSVQLQDRSIILADSEWRETLTPIVGDTSAPGAILAALAAAWGLGLEIEAIRDALPSLT